MARITDPTKDVAKINSEFERLDRVMRENERLKSLLDKVETRLQKVEAERDLSTSNNLTFTWAGGTLTLSWADGYLKDRHKKHYRVPAGSSALTASTFYWVAWNPVHQSMSFSATLDPLLSIPGCLVVGNLKTGTGAQNGTAGGGGSFGGGDDLSGDKYNNFP